MARKSDGTLAGTFPVRRGGLDGGGWTTDNPICADGRGYAATDTAGCYTRAPGASRWDQMFTIGHSVADELVLPDGVPGMGNSGTGCYAIAPCRDHSAKGTLAMVGRWWRFVDCGLTAGSVTPIGGFPTQQINSNEGARMHHSCGATDPQNPNHAVLGTPQGLWYIDGTGDAVKNASVPAPTDRITAAFDPSSPIVGGKHQVIYLRVPGHGLMRSTTGASGTFSVVAGGPTSMGTLKVGPTGTVYMPGANPNRYKDGAFAAVLPGDCHAVAPHPTDPAKLWGVNGGGGLWFSADQGSTATGYAGKMRVARGIPYMQATNEIFMSAGNLAYDPIAQNLSFVEGLGEWVYNSPATTNVAATTVVYEERTRGIAQLCVDDIRVVHKPGHPLDGQLLVSTQDRGFWAIARDEVDRPPTGHGPGYTEALQHGSTQDAAPDDPNYHVAVSMREHDSQGRTGTVFESYAGGAPGTWVSMPEPLGASGGVEGSSGTVACGGVGRALLLPYWTDDRRAQLIKPGGGWFYADIAGGLPLGPMGDTYTDKTRRASHDPFEPGTYYAMLTGDHNNATERAAVQGYWQIKDDGTPAVRMHDAVESYAYTHYNTALKPNPLRQGHFGYTSGHAGGENPAGIGLWLTTDHFANMRKLPGFSEVYDFDYAARDVEGGEAYERMVLMGFRDDGDFGLWVAYNIDLAGSTITYQFRKIAKWPAGWYDEHRRVAADKTLFGRAYVGGMGSSYSAVDYDCKRRWVA